MTLAKRSRLPMSCLFKGKYCVHGTYVNSSLMMKINSTLATKVKVLTQFHPLWTPTITACTTSNVLHEEKKESSPWQLHHHFQICRKCCTLTLFHVTSGHVYVPCMLSICLSKLGGFLAYCVLIPVYAERQG